MKKVLAAILVAVMAFSLAGWSSVQASGKKSKSKKPKIGIVLSTGGLGDKNFNDMAYAGLLKAQEKLGIQFDYVEPKSVSDFVPQLRMFAESKEYSLIIGIGNDQSEAMKEVSKNFPKQKFSIIDSNINMPNVSSIYTKWQEQTFLCGVIAGLGTKSKLKMANAENVVGVILGQDQPTLRKGAVGFMAGVRYVNPKAQILEATVGNFNDPGKCKEIALSMYGRGADFIQHIAGASGLGLFNAAKQSKRYAFGVGGNQNAIEPDHIVATSIRNVNEIVYNEVKSAIGGTWEAGVHISGIKEGAVGYSTQNSKVKLPKAILAAVEAAKKKIICGQLVPCENADQLEEWTTKNQYKK
jgi:basic membrane protein A